MSFHQVTIEKMKENVLRSSTVDCVKASEDGHNQESTPSSTSAPTLFAEAAHVLLGDGAQASRDAARTKVRVRGYDFNKFAAQRIPASVSDPSNRPIFDYEALFRSFGQVGFTAYHLENAVQETNRMIAARQNEAGVIFLGYTSNMVSCGNREVIRFLCQHKLIDCIVTTAGGVEEDLIKCLANTYLIGDYAEGEGSALRLMGANRIGNLMVPNNNYVLFEDFLAPILDQMTEEQNLLGINWTPSKLIRRMGKEINNEDSIYYWCYKNDIPVYCPAITDGSIGDIIFFSTYKKQNCLDTLAEHDQIPVRLAKMKSKFDAKEDMPCHACSGKGKSIDRADHVSLRLDAVEDNRNLNQTAMRAPKSGCLILGGGVAKHQIMNANLMRNGADFCVYLNTGNEYEGSDSGASPDEAVSWGKLKAVNNAVKVHMDASVSFPLLVSQTFAKHHHQHLQASSE